MLGPQTLVICPRDSVARAGTSDLPPNVSLDMCGLRRLMAIACSRMHPREGAGQGWLPGNEPCGQFVGWVGPSLMET